MDVSVDESGHDDRSVAFGIELRIIGQISCRFDYALSNDNSGGTYSLRKENPPRAYLSQVFDQLDGLIVGHSRSYNRQHIDDVLRDTVDESVFVDDQLTIGSVFRQHRTTEGINRKLLRAVEQCFTQVRRSID